MQNRYPLEPLVGRILSPFERFLGRTSAGGIVLVAATVVSLAIATALEGNLVSEVTQRHFGLSGAGSAFDLTLLHWVNDGLMTLFFLLVGLELKREVLVGELSSWRDALLPVAAALGGMVAPALVYLAFNARGDGAAGWGIPMATDIAFTVGILVLLTWRVPRNLVVFVTALAIADDLGAVLVIGVFYTPELDLAALGAGAALFAVLVLFNRAGIRHPLPYVLVGVALWLAVHASGAHATLTGVLMALTVPARASRRPAQFERRASELLERLREERTDAATPDDALANEQVAHIAEAMEDAAIQAQSPLQRMEHALAPWVTFAVIPVFALCNAGIDLRAVRWSTVLDDPVTLGVACALLFGKFLGVASFTWLAIRLGVGRLPAGVSWRHMLGAAWLTGIGFTMSLFIAQLAFADAQLVEAAKLGIILGSAFAAVVGMGWLYLAAGKQAAGVHDYNQAS